MLAAGHRHAHETSITPEDLVHEPMVLLDLPVSREYFLSAFQQKGLRPHIVEGTADIAVMRSMVANGFGYGIANMRPLHSMSPDGKPLTFVPIKGAIRPLTMGVLLPKAAHRTQTVQAFIDHCRDFVMKQNLFGMEGAVE